MKYMILLSLLVSFNAFAKETTQTLNGTGIDGKPCSVSIVRNGEKLKEVTLKGASEVFEILAEKEGGVGPQTQINSRGGEEILQIVQENKDLYKYFTYSNAIFSDTEEFSLDTNDIENKEKIPFKMVAAVRLSYNDGVLSEVKAASKMKTLGIVTLASSKFVCTK